MKLWKKIQSVKEFKIQRATGALKKSDIVTIAKSKRTNPKILEYLWTITDLYETNGVAHWGNYTKGNYSVDKLGQNQEHLYQMMLLDTILSNPNCPTEVLVTTWRILSTKTRIFNRVAPIVLSNPNFDQLICKEIIQEITSRSIPTYSYRAVALWKNPNTSSTDRDQLIKFGPWNLLSMVAKLKSTPISTIKMILDRTNNHKCADEHYHKARYRALDRLYVEGELV